MLYGTLTVIHVGISSKALSAVVGTCFALMLMALMAVTPLNACSPMNDKLAGSIIIPLKPEQLRNAWLPTYWIESGRASLPVKEVHPEKASSSIRVNALGMTRLPLRLEHPLKAPAPMV